jgi:hypothetical protein
MRFWPAFRTRYPRAVGLARKCVEQIGEDEMVAGDEVILATNNGQGMFSPEV